MIYIRYLILYRLASGLARRSLQQWNTHPKSWLRVFFRTKAAAYASPTTVKAWMDSGNQDFVLVDVRLRGAARTWQIPGSLEIPATQMGERLNELPKDKMIVLYCWDTWCSLATTAAVVLADHGYRVKELFGGVAAWQVLHLPEERIGESTVPPSPACAC
jgi:rhodanese-related sulfurtransferase